MPEPSFATDNDMLYAASRTVFVPGAPFRLDEAYRRAHLPLVAPGHRDVIAEGRGYVRGVHAPSLSLVLPIEAEALASSAPYVSLEAALRASPFAGKIAWDLLPKRAERLHATVAGGVNAPAGRLPDALRERIGALGGFRYQLRGLFSGNRNLGRLYLALYPQIRGGENALAPVQRALGAKPNAMFLMGQFNLVDHLTAGEAQALAALLDQMRDVVFLTATARELCVLESRDDLVLDARFTDRIALRPG